MTDTKPGLFSPEDIHMNNDYCIANHRSKYILVLEGHRSAWHERVQTLVVGGVSIRNRSVISN